MRPFSTWTVCNIYCSGFCCSQDFVSGLLDALTSGTMRLGFECLTGFFGRNNNAEEIGISMRGYDNKCNDSINYKYCGNVMWQCTAT